MSEMSSSDPTTCVWDTWSMVESHASSESKPWLIGLYRGSCYPVIGIYHDLSSNYKIIGRIPTSIMEWHGGFDHSSSGDVESKHTFPVKALKMGPLKQKTFRVSALKNLIHRVFHGPKINH